VIELEINDDKFLKGLQGCLTEIEACVGGRVKEIVTYIDRKAHERTPVYTGQAVRNMVWSVGQGGSSELPAIENPAETGHTSDMGLGEEPRRHANQEAAQETLKALDFGNPFQTFVMTNASPDIGLIEDGAAGLPGKSRAPNGVFAITMAEVMNKLKAGAPLQ